MSWWPDTSNVRLREYPWLLIEPKILYLRRTNFEKCYLTKSCKFKLREKLKIRSQKNEKKNISNLQKIFDWFKQTVTILKSGKFTFQAQVRHLKNSLNSAPSSVSTRTCESEKLKLLFPNHTSPIQQAVVKNLISINLHFFKH